MICSCKAMANKSGNSTLVFSIVTTKQFHKSDSSNNQTKIFHGNIIVESNEDMKWTSHLKHPNAHHRFYSEQYKSN
jgi:hypothetical protein